MRIILKVPTQEKLLFGLPTTLCVMLRSSSLGAEALDDPPLLTFRLSGSFVSFVDREVVRESPYSFGFASLVFFGLTLPMAFGPSRLVFAILLKSQK